MNVIPGVGFLLLTGLGSACSDPSALEPDATTGAEGPNPTVEVTESADGSAVGGTTAADAADSGPDESGSGEGTFGVPAATSSATDTTDVGDPTGTSSPTDGGETSGSTSGESTSGESTSGGSTSGELPPASNRVLMFVAYNNTWWAEYKVMAEGLRAQGYEVEVRSSTDGAVAHSYGEPVDQTPSGVPGVGPLPYEEFRVEFEMNFGVEWDGGWNVPDDIPLDGRIQEADMADYAALVFPGGSGSQFSRYDGNYEDLPGLGGGHVSPAVDIASAAESINALVVAALVAGSPVLGVCHAGPTAAFARVPGTEGEGPAGLGLSVLDGRSATGYPLEIEVYGAVGDVALQYQALGIQFLPEQAVVVDGPDVDLDGDGRPDGAGLVVTARSWYPGEIVMGLRTMLDLME